MWSLDHMMGEMRSCWSNSAFAPEVEIILFGIIAPKTPHLPSGILSCKYFTCLKKMDGNLCANTEMVVVGNIVSEKCR